VTTYADSSALIPSYVKSVALQTQAAVQANSKFSWLRARDLNQQMMARTTLNRQQTDPSIVAFVQRCPVLAHSVQQASAKSGKPRHKTKAK
jgi:hypothetical protein